MMSAIPSSLRRISSGPKPKVSSSTSSTSRSRSPRFSSGFSVSQRCSTTRRISRRSVSPSRSPSRERSSLSTSLPWISRLRSSKSICSPGRPVEGRAPGRDEAVRAAGMAARERGEEPGGAVVRRTGGPVREPRSCRWIGTAAPDAGSVMPFRNVRAERSCGFCDAGADRLHPFLTAPPDRPGSVPADGRTIVRLRRGGPAAGSSPVRPFPGNRPCPHRPPCCPSSPTAASSAAGSSAAEPPAAGSPGTEFGAGLEVAESSKTTAGAMVPARGGRGG